LLDRAVLGIDPLDARVRLGPLDLAVDAPVVAYVALGAERLLVHVVGTVAVAVLAPILVGERLVGLEAVLEVPDHARVVVHWDPEVAGPRVARISGQRCAKQRPRA